MPDIREPDSAMRANFHVKASASGLFTFRGMMISFDLQWRCR